MSGASEEERRAHRLLLVTGRSDLAENLARHLREVDPALRLEPVETVERALAVLGERTYEACLLDLELPSGQRAHLLERIQDEYPHLAVVAVGDSEGRASLERALRVGADDYLATDGLSPSALARTLRHARDCRRALVERWLVEEKWWTVFDVLPVGVVISEAKTGRLLEMNDAFVEIFGQPREAMVGSSALELGQWEDPDHRGAVVDRVRKEGAVYGEEAWFRDARGRRGRMLLSCRQLEVSGEDLLLWSVLDVTERAERERFMATIASNLPGALYRCRIDRDWTMEYLSPRILDLTGYEAEAFLEEPPLSYGDLIHPADRERVWRTVQRGLEEDRPFRLEYRIRTRGGEERWVWEQGRGVKPVTGEGERLEGYIVDISEQKAAERALEESHRQLDQLVATMNEAVVFIDRGGRIRFVNPAAERLFGASRGELEARTFDDPRWRITTRDGEPFPVDALPFRRVMATGELVTGVQHAVEREDAERILLSVNAAPLRDAEGSLKGVVASMRDLTLEVEREEELRRSEERFRTLFEHSRDPILILDLEGRMLATNDAALTLTGYDRRECPALRVPDLMVRPSDWKSLRERLEAEGGVTRFEAKLRTRQGEERTVEISATLRAEPGGRRIQMILRDVTERRRLERDLRYRALHDPLTGLANRNLFRDRLQGALARRSRRPGALALLLLDIRRFKTVNDSLGHTAGDRILEEVARRLEARARAEDTVVRFGGDEFLLLLETVSEPGALDKIVDRLMSALRRPYRVGDRSIELDFNVGAVLYDLEDASGNARTVDPETLVRYADLGLVRAKGAAGSHVHLVSLEDRPEEDILSREQDLRRGVKAREFDVFFQPVVEVATGRLWGCEALARWRHPERGVVGPGEFIALAEEIDLIHELGAQICNTALGHAARWTGLAGNGPPHLLLNISGRQFASDGFPDLLAGSLESAGLEPGRVYLEVTESAVIQATGRVDVLRDQGFRVLIDDFGTGYSSFHYLRDLEVDGLKVDLSFVQGLTEDDTRAAIVETILTLGRRLGVLTVAEGVETEAQLERLRTLGADRAQGYYLARPMPADEMEARLARIAERDHLWSPEADGGASA